MMEENQPVILKRNIGLNLVENKTNLVSFGGNDLCLIREFSEKKYFVKKDLPQVKFCNFWPGWKKWSQLFSRKKTLIIGVRDSL